MKFDKIVAFGDSLVWGDELLAPHLQGQPGINSSHMDNTAYRERHCFSGLIAAHYGVDHENFGWPGGSLQSTIWTYLWWIEHETRPLSQCLVLVGLTESNRTSFYNNQHVGHGNDPPWNRFMHSTWLASQAGDRDWSDMYKRYAVLTDCAELHRVNLLQALLFFHGQRQQCCGLFQFKTMASVETSRDDLLLWPQSDIRSSLLSTRPNSLLCPQGHPNEQGHRLIADLLISEIDRVILSE